MHGDNSDVVCAEKLSVTSKIDKVPCNDQNETNLTGRSCRERKLSLKDTANRFQELINLFLKLHDGNATVTNSTEERLVSEFTYKKIGCNASRTQQRFLGNKVYLLLDHKANESTQDRCIRIAIDKLKTDKDFLQS